MKQLKWIPAIVLFMGQVARGVEPLPFSAKLTCQNGDQTMRVEFENSQTLRLEYKSLKSSAVFDSERSRRLSKQYRADISAYRLSDVDEETFLDVPDIFGPEISKTPVLLGTADKPSFFCRVEVALAFQAGSVASSSGVRSPYPHDLGKGGKIYCRAEKMDATFLAYKHGGGNDTFVVPEWRIAKKTYKGFNGIATFLLDTKKPVTGNSKLTESFRMTVKMPARAGVTPVICETQYVTAD